MPHSDRFARGCPVRWRSEAVLSRPGREAVENRRLGLESAVVEPKKPKTPDADRVI